MKKYHFTFVLAILIFSCSENDNSLDENILAEYIEISPAVALDDVIACAAGISTGFPTLDEEPTSVFFYPVSGASDFRYYETAHLSDSLDFRTYIRKYLEDEPVFNGYLWKFNNTSFEEERMGVVTYINDNMLHISTPIRLKTNVKPTEINNSLVSIEENGTHPSFTWEDGLIDENVIYFQVISDADGNLISGTYTYDRSFTFYNLENVVLNVSPSDPTPSLEPGEEYIFTLMAVSEDNWVNLSIEQTFITR